MRVYRKTVMFNIRLNRLILIFFAILSIVGFVFMQNKLLENVQKVGNYIAYNYAEQEKSNIITYQTLLQMGTQYIDKMHQNGASYDEMKIWLEETYAYITKLFNSSDVNIYAVVDGKIIAGMPWEGAEGYDYQSKQWYQDAIKANGKVIYTDVYTDVVTGKRVVTIAQKSENTDTVMLFDVSLENFRAFLSEVIKPSGSIYLLCDSKGNPIYFEDNMGYTYDNMSSYIKTILREIDEGKYNNYNSTGVSPTGQKQGVYYYELSNGWKCVVLIPLSTLFDDLKTFTVAFAAFLLIFFAIIIYMAIRYRRAHRKISHVTDTMQVLGDSYYAIYRVNYKKRTFEAIKSSPDVDKLIGHTGVYDDLVTIISEFVDDDIYRDVKKSFCIENIEKLVQEKINDFGGDYIRRFGDEKKWVNVRLLQDPKLMPDEVVLCFSEVDAEKKMQLKHIHLLESALESAKESEKSKTTFFNSMSHDMRTPLNVIINLANLIQTNKNNPEKVEEYIKKIEYSGKQLLSLINDLLEVSRLDNAKIDLSNEVIDIKECIEMCVGSFNEVAQKQNKHINTEFKIQNNMVIGDSFRISQIMNNLLSNAFKYSDEGASVSVNVKQIKQDKNSQYQIVVSDTGIGMSEEFVEKIFDYYSRETRFASNKVIGTGLGMSIVQKIVHQMDGEIKVKSKLGEGSSFTVTLPFQVLEQKAIKTEKTEDNKINLAGKHILIAEDNEINMEIATEILKMQNVEVSQAYNGKQAVEMFEKSELNYFDAILMDMLMPEMDGCEAAKAIRALDREDAKTLPIIAVTANAFSEDIAKTTEAGMNAHLSKPIDFEVLCKTMSELVKN